MSLYGGSGAFCFVYDKEQEGFGYRKIIKASEKGINMEVFEFKYGGRV